MTDMRDLARRLVVSPPAWRPSDSGDGFICSLPEGDVRIKKWASGSLGERYDLAILGEAPDEGEGDRPEVSSLITGSHLRETADDLKLLWLLWEGAVSS